MSEYTSNRDGFQRAMEWSITGKPEDAILYVEATSTPNYYHIVNNQRIEYDDHMKYVAEWRAKVSDYKPIVHEFLRDGDQLAARMTGAIKVDGVANKFESFLFAKVEKQSGKLEWLIERSMWGPV